MHLQHGVDDDGAADIARFAAQFAQLPGDRRSVRGGRAWCGDRRSLLRFARAHIGKKNKAADAPLQCLARAFNKRQLRRGDRCIIPGETVVRARGTWGGKTWQTAGVQAAAYRGVGQGPRTGHRRGEVALECTHRGAEVSSAAAQVHRLAQDAALLEQVAGPAKEGRVQAVFVSRHWDATPIMFRFGEMQAKVAPHARYFKKQPNGKWKSLSLEDYMLEHPRAQPGAGVLELCAMRFDVAWAFHDKLVGCQEYLAPPCALQDGRASTMHAALEAAAPPLTDMKLLEMANEVGTVVLSECPDMCAANKRKRVASESVLGEASNIFVSPILGCASHTLHNCLQHISSEKRHIGDVHAMAYVLTAASRRNALMNGLMSVLEDVLEYDDLAVPDPEWADHTRQIMLSTIGREGDTVGSADGVNQPVYSSDVLERVQKAAPSNQIRLVSPTT